MGCGAWGGHAHLRPWPTSSAHTQLLLGPGVATGAYCHHPHFTGWGRKPRGHSNLPRAVYPAPVEQGPHLCTRSPGHRSSRQLVCSEPPGTGFGALRCSGHPVGPKRLHSPILHLRAQETSWDDAGSAKDHPEPTEHEAGAGSSRDPVLPHLRGWGTSPLASAPCVPPPPASEPLLLRPQDCSSCLPPPASLPVAHPPEQPKGSCLLWVFRKHLIHITQKAPF